ARARPPVALRGHRPDLLAVGHAPCVAPPEGDRPAPGRARRGRQGDAQLGHLRRHRRHRRGPGARAGRRRRGPRGRPGRRRLGRPRAGPERPHRPDPGHRRRNGSL
ncbi:MAG: hypothetical protein AVDCRST_MAG06-1489, partial [uncultured Nocardioides sp.]